MKKFPIIVLTLIAFAIPFLTGKFVNFDTGSAVIFMIIIVFLLVRHRKVLSLQPLIKIFNIPLIYAVLWKTKFGIKFMDRIASKYRELVKLIGYSFIGFGFFGLIFISFNVIVMLFNLFVTPKEASQSVALVLPLTNIPGIGFLSFWHFLITIFITVLVHEFAHGIVARAHNVPVKASGLGVFALLVPIFPLAFVEPDEEKLNKSKDVVQYSIFAAGPMVNIVLAVLIWLLLIFAITPIENNITHPIGFTFNALMENYSAQEAGMQPGMIINKVNGVEVLDYQGFSDEINNPKPDTELTVSTANETFTVITKPSPNDPKKGFIGISDIRNERRINENFEAVGGIFFWFKGLFRWLYFINLMIGLMNLLPLIVTDGGRMLKTAFEKIFIDKKKAEKAWVFIGSVFIFTLLFAIFLKYIVFGLLGL